jgi:hypothetical protein
MYSIFEQEDEIESIEFIGFEDTIDINTSGNRLFYANGILTHNSSVEEVEFDHSHIAGGISKINTADNVFGIFTSRSMKEQGKYQIQCMKSRSSTGVGNKIDLLYDMDTMRISDLPDGEQESSGFVRRPNVLDRLKDSSTTSSIEEINEESPKIEAEFHSTKLKQLMNDLKSGR